MLPKPDLLFKRSLGPEILKQILFKSCQIFSFLVQELDQGVFLHQPDKRDVQITYVMVQTRHHTRSFPIDRWTSRIVGCPDHLCDGADTSSHRFLPNWQVNHVQKHLHTGLFPYWQVRHEDRRDAHLLSGAERRHTYSFLYQQVDKQVQRDGKITEAVMLQRHHICLFPAGRWASKI